jgi:hypothetical protein
VADLARAVPTPHHDHGGTAINFHVLAHDDIARDHVGGVDVSYNYYPCGAADRPTVLRQLRAAIDAELGSADPAGLVPGDRQLPDGGELAAALTFLDKLAVCHADEFADAQRYLDVRDASGYRHP